MQRLGENAMWLREDNLQTQNEIVLPYDDDLVLWDRPSWMDSLFRLRWCCPSKAPKQATPKSKKLSKKKKKGKAVKQDKYYRSNEKPVPSSNNNNNNGKRYHDDSYEYENTPPPSSYMYQSHNPYEMSNHRGGYPQYHNNHNSYHPSTQEYGDQQQHQMRHRDQQLQQPLPPEYMSQKQQQEYFQAHNRHHADLVYSIHNSYHLQPPQLDHVTLSSLSSSGSAHRQNNFPPPTNTESIDRRAATGTDGKPSKAAAAAAEAAAATLKKQGEKQQQRYTQASKNPNLPPLMIRGSSATPQGQHDATAGVGGVKPPLAQRGSRPVSPLALMPPSPQSERPRLLSESSRRSVGTASTRHRRQVHESFQFSSNSLQQIVHKDDANLPKTSPPAYIECPTHHPHGERRWSWGSLEQIDFKRSEDDNNSIDMSIDGEIGNLLNQGHGPQKPRAGYISPVDDDDEDDGNGLRQRNPNVPALSWLNSWAAQGDAAAGGDARGESRSSKIKRSKEKQQHRNKMTASHVGPEQLPQINYERPIFLPRCRAFDKPVRKGKKRRVVTSGWAAISLSDQLRNRLVVMEGPLQLKRSDISYFQVIQDSDSKKRPILRIKKDGQDHDFALKDRYDHQVQSREVCGRAGRCISLSDVASGQVLVTILPVSLPKYFFREDKIVDEHYFNAYQPALFTPFTTTQPRLTPEQSVWGPEFCLTQYAPDEQYDAATHVLFAIDSMLKVEKLKFPATFQIC